jgi:glycosyltransferase involved in cell wall biosynthesis
LNRVYLAVINDLISDQRAHRVAQTLHGCGVSVMLIGRRFTHSPPVNDRDYGTRRFRLIFNRGFLFYQCFNIRLFFWLLFRKKGIIVGNDLDTLPACWLVSKIRRLPLVYDSHEYFTEVPELMGRKFVRNFWLSIEKRIVPGIIYAYTVSEPIAEAYRKAYNVNFRVVRNLPYRLNHPARHKDLLPCDAVRTIIYQGSLNPGRGLEFAILAMKHLEKFRLQIFGDGPLRKDLEKIVMENNLTNRVLFMGRVPLNELPSYTCQASLGISLEENLGMNYYYSLPNKLFDYIQARIPVLVSGLPEMRKIVETYDVGLVTESLEPSNLARLIDEMMNNDEKRIAWKKNLRIAADELCWEKEVKKLLEIYMEAGLEGLIR